MEDVTGLSSLSAENVAAQHQGSVLNSQRKQAESVASTILDGVAKALPDGIGGRLDVEA